MSQRRFKLRHPLARKPMAAPSGTRMRVLEQWLTFSAMTLKDAGPDQKRELRRAFYAGFEAFYRVCMTATDTTTPDCTDGDLSVMEDMHNELAAFAREVEEGRA